jgi:hypothetical protein
MAKIYKKGVRYYSKKKGIVGLILGGVRNSGWNSDYYVVERFDSDKDKRGVSTSKIVCKGTITECRNYMRKRFRG